MQKPSNKSRNNFLVVLLNLWWKQARLLVARIKSLPQNRKLMKELITLSIVICVGVWAINTGRCANCKRTMGFLNGDLHLSPCGNCGVKIYFCPERPDPNIHPHRKRCDICGRSYWDCPTKSEADKHGETICKPLIKGVRPPKIILDR